MKIKHLAIAAAALAASFTSALAQTPTCQIGIQTGYSHANTELSLGGFSIDGIGSHSTRPDAGVRGGCDLTAGEFRFGAFAEWNNQDVTFSVNPGLFSASLGNSYSLGGRFGLVFDKVFAYGLVAWTHTDVSWSVAGPGLPSAFTGMTYGGGLEYPIRDTRVSLAMEARLTQFTSETIGGPGGLELQPDQLQAMLRLNWNFYDAPKAAKPLK